MFQEQPGQNRDPLPGRQRGRPLNRQTLASEIVAPRQHLERCCAFGRVEKKIYRPDMTGKKSRPCRRVPFFGRFALFAGALGNLQSLRFPEPMHPVGAGQYASSPQKVKSLAATAPSLCLREIAQTLSEFFVFVRARRVLKGRAIDLQEPTSAARGKPAFRKKGKKRTRFWARQPFFARYSWSASIARSRSNALSRCASQTLRPLHFLRQREKGTSEMPAARRSSEMDCSSRSAWCRTTDNLLLRKRMSLHGCSPPFLRSLTHPMA